MSHENLVERALAELGLAASSLAVLSRINRTRISQCLRGQSSFTGPESLLLADLIEQLRAIVKDSQPIPIDWTDCRAIQKLLEHRRQQIRWTATATKSEQDK